VSAGKVRQVGVHGHARTGRPRRRRILTTGEEDRRQCRRHAGGDTPARAQVLDGRRVLCIGPEGLSVVTFSPGYKSFGLRLASPPLPAGVKIVNGMVSPDREHLAYLTLTSSVLSLYMKPLANDNEPVLVADAVSTNGPGYARLAEWRDS
jgi:hypothetical protein